jgi:uncharacterized OsmC-like protein
LLNIRFNANPKTGENDERRHGTDEIRHRQRDRRGRAEAGGIGCFAGPGEGRGAVSGHLGLQGQTRSRATVESFHLGGQEVKRHFEIDVDEPVELLGENTAPNPQEMLMTALNACIMVGYVAGAAMKGIRLDKVEIETSGQLDLRGFLGIDASVPPGYEMIRYTVTMKGDGNEADFREIHETVMKTSPNYFNIARPVRIESELVVER